MTRCILVARCEGVMTITLNRPDKLNSFAGTMREELLESLGEARAPDVRAVVITGAGKGFCAGGDIESMAKLKRREDTAGFRRLLDLGAAVVTQIYELNKPVVAKVNGVAAGAGCNLALACDLRVAASDATFVESFHRLGLGPDWGGTFFLPRLVGPARAVQMIWSTEPVTASQALEWGLVNSVADPAGLERGCADLVAKLVAGPGAAMAAAKRNARRDRPRELSEALAAEIAAQELCFRSQDFADRLAAFLAVRTSRPRPA